MLKVGIVGNLHALSAHLATFQKLTGFDMLGVYDPALQFEDPTIQRQEAKLYTSLNHFLAAVDAVFVLSCEKVNLPLIQQVVKNSLPVFLYQTSHFNLAEHQSLLKLSEETGQLIQVYHPFPLETIVESKPYLQKVNQISFRGSFTRTEDLMPGIRSCIAMSLRLAQSSLKRTSVSSFNVFRDVPDSFHINLEFSNGSITQINLNAVELRDYFESTILLHDRVYQMDLLAASCEHISRVDDVKVKTEIATEPFSLSAQLSLFRTNILEGLQPANGIFHEHQTQVVMEKVKENIKATFNFI